MVRSQSSRETDPSLLPRVAVFTKAIRFLSAKVGFQSTGKALETRGAIQLSENDGTAFLQAFLFSASR